MRIYIYTILISFFTLNIAFAQQNRYEANIGIHAGIINYYGDLNDKIISPNERIRNFKLDYLSYGISAERNLSSSWSAKIQYTWGKFIANDRAIKWDGSKDDANSNYNRSLNAKTNIDDFGFMFTYYTDNGKLFSKNAFLSPYISFGADVTLFKVYADLKDANGERYYYWPDNTIKDLPEGSSNAAIVKQDGTFETNVTNLETEGDYNNTVLNIPFGGGLKFRITERVNLNLDYTIRYTFTDYLDDVSGNYKQEYTSDFQAYAANPTGVIADERGSGNANDWYAFASVSLHYSLGKKEKAFVTTPINFSNTYEQTVLRSSIHKVDTLSSLPLQTLTILRDSIARAPQSQISKTNISTQKIDNGRRLGSGRPAQKGYAPRNMGSFTRTMRRDTLDSLHYMVRKQSLENELYRLRISSPDPNVRLKAKEDSLKSTDQFKTKEYKKSGTAVSQKNLVAPDTLANSNNDSLVQKRKKLDEQLNALNRQLQQMQEDTVAKQKPMEAADTVVRTDSSNVQLKAKEEAYTKKIDSLQTVVTNLKSEKNDTLQKAQKKDAEMALLKQRIDTLNTQIETLKADTSSTHNNSHKADSLSMLELQHNQDILRTQLKTLSEKQDYQNENPRYAQSPPGNDDDTRRINSLEKEIDRLRFERDNAQNYRRADAMKGTSNNQENRIDNLERDVDRLDSRKGTTVQPVVTPVVAGSASSDNDNEGVRKNQQRIDSLQQQIATLSAQKNTVADSNTTAAPNNQAEVENLKQEIEALRANIVAMDQDKADEANEAKKLPEIPKTEVFFGVGSSTLTASDKKRIVELVSFVKQYPSAGILLKGFTDPTGSPAKNLVLSKRRAESVKQLLRNEGIANEKIDTEFFGADNKALEDLSYGRRVEILIQ